MSLQGGVIAFTGRLASMKRADAFALVAEHGGRPREGVTKDTRVLIVGELGWPLQDDGQPSKSLATAKSYGIPIVNERRFLEWVGKAVPQEQAKTYAATQLAALSKLPGEVVEQLSMFGLIEAREGLYGFRDLAAARQVAQLLGSGTPLSVITRSLRDIRKWLPDARLSNLRLFPESADRVLVEQVRGRTDSKGQFVLDVSKPEDSADAAFAQAQSAEEAGDTAAAEAQYRRVMKLDPSDPAAGLNLGNLLREQKRTVEAEAAYRRAVKADPHFAPAWHNLADLLDDGGRLPEAIDCERRALDADPGYADAVFNMALFLQRLERHEQAAPVWRRYLALDRDSPWAERAKRALKYCEIQLANTEPTPEASVKDSGATNA
ncbi:MAG TPA: tetratricopeptide repeat protein [Xanthobacteraceae bacterium]|nr:tetratricopeptide repeat protein [Xanthobacteraceae bacterium]